jgi:hypothetical protein
MLIPPSCIFSNPGAPLAVSGFLTIRFGCETSSQSHSTCSRVASGWRTVPSETTIEQKPSPPSAAS